MPPLSLDSGPSIQEREGSLNDGEQESPTAPRVGHLLRSGCCTLGTHSASQDGLARAALTTRILSGLTQQHLFLTHAINLTQVAQHGPSGTWFSQRVCPDTHLHGCHLGGKGRSGY